MYLYRATEKKKLAYAEVIASVLVDPNPTPNLCCNPEHSENVLSAKKSFRLTSEDKSVNVQAAVFP